MTHNLIVMTFDGDYHTEREGFETVQDAWEHCDDMGSRWFFFPFPFVTTASGKTVVDSCLGLKFLNGKRVSTVRRMFKELSDKPEVANADCDMYIAALQGVYS